MSVGADVWRQVVAHLRSARGVLLTTHQNPDGDGIGSMLALWHYLRHIGVPAVAHCVDSVPRIYRFLSGSGQVGSGAIEMDAIDTIVCLDCGAKGRLARDDAFFSNRFLINIDHHRSNKNFGDMNVVDADYCATGVMIRDLIAADGGVLTPEIAEAIYVTVVTDTGNFRHRGVDARVHRLAAELIEAGVDPERVAMEIYSSNSSARMRLMAEALDSLCFSHQGRVAWISVTEAAYRRSGADVEDTEGLIDIAASVAGVEVAVFLRPHAVAAGAPESWKASFRSRGRVQVGDLAADMGGGGHPCAAGCLLRGSQDEVRSLVEVRLTPLIEALGSATGEVSAD